MGKLKDWAEEQSSFVTLEDGESITVVYKGYKVVPNSFDPDKTTVQYVLEIDGKRKFWSTGSAKVARALDALKEGTEITIRREGEGPNTKYHIAPKESKKAA